MKNKPARLVNRSCYVLGGWLLAVTANAQNIPSDSAAVFTGSTIVTVQPVPVLFGTINLGVEQTLSKRSSIQLTGQHFIGRQFIQIFGQVQGASASFLYYPLATQTAPHGFFVGPRLTYRRLTAPVWLRFLTGTDNTSTVSIWSAEAVAGYQYCSRQNFVFTTQGSIGFLHHINHQQPDPTGRLDTNDRTRFAPFPGISMGIGYRFGNRRR